MMDIRTIKLLQDNKKPFKFMGECNNDREEMQKELRHIQDHGSGDDLSVLGTDGAWAVNRNSELYDGHTYRLRLDYEEEPEVVKCEVIQHQGDLMYKQPELTKPYDLACAFVDPDFIGFLYEDGTISTCSRIYARKGNTCPWVYVSESDLSNCEVLTPTYVLFKGKS